MTPTPPESVVPGKTEPLRRPPPGDEVVISGMSGIFPGSDSIPEFMENLYNKVDMVTSNNPRWVFNHPEVPKHLGIVNGMGKFDAQFFRVHYKQACTMEPMSRKLLEHAYSAIYDSGINPLQLRGKKVGVFIGSTFSESEKIVIYENVQRNGFGITGCNKAMYANRISYWIDGKGPSYSLDLACASSTACIEHAFRSISSGQCEAAIVGGCNLCMHPNVSLNCRRAGFLCLDGKTKCFDKDGDGHVRSDTISVLFLQKAKDAKRIYSEVYHAKATYSSALEPLVPVREPKELQQFLEAFYSEIGVSPDDVEYIEANGAAVPEADINELKAIGEVFAKKKPIRVGCVKSNMGSSEPASGVCGITKVCLAYHKGMLSGNLHYNEPLDIPEVQDKIQVLTDNEAFGRGFAALNSFSYSGANIHVLLKGYYKQKDIQRYKSSIPYLVLVSGRQDDCVKTILDNLKKQPIDPEQIALIHNIHKYDTPGHMSRGYSLLDTNEKNENISLSQSVEYCSGVTRPIWFVYSGMGSQWATMGADLMKIPIFAAAVQKCHKVLEPKGVDIVKILTDPDKAIYDNILHSFVGIAAVQIGLTDILKEMGIVPDHIIGHSVGELGCAYADGCFTAEEMILSAYSRGLVSVQTPFIRGSMAAVGLGYKTVLPMCPAEIEVACHNSSESSTISGPADIMKQFVTELTNQGIFAKEVPCSNIAYHSRYIAEAGPGLLKYLSEVIKNPKERSQKWVSTSVPQEKWDDPLAKYSSAEYHTNNLLNSVLFEETSKLIPPEALVIEIAPHGLLQAILKRSLANCVHVPLTRRGVAEPVKFLLDAFGKLYQAGLNLKIDVLYPKIDYPVSTGTPFLSQYVEWEHSEDWPQAKYNTKDRVIATVRDFVMSVYDDDFKYFKGHVRDGHCVFPESTFLVLVWETLAMYKGVTNYKDLSVVFENVQFHGEAIITPELPVRLQIMILKGNNKFEITYEESTIVSGFVSIFNANDTVHRNLPQKQECPENIYLSSKDIYTIMRLRGYGYKDEFQSIHSSTSSRNKASIKWTDNWITYLDSLLQFNAFAKEFDGISIPSRIKKLKIDVQNHKYAKLVMVDNVTCLNADFYDVYEHTSSGGVEIDGLVFKDKPNVEQKPDVILTQTFVPHFLTGVVPIKIALQVNLQIIIENVSENCVKIINHISPNESKISETITEVTDVLQHEFNIVSVNDINVESVGNSDVIIIDNLLADEKKMNDFYKILPQNTFILALEQDKTVINPQYKLFSVITAMTVQEQILLLLRKNVKTDNNENITYMPIVHDQKFSWIPRLQTELQRSKKIVLISERQHYCGLLGLVKKLKQEHGNKIGFVIVDDFHAPSFDPEKDIFKNQLDKKLAFNVLKKGQWGGYYNISSKPAKQLQNLYLTSTAPGDFDALSWIEKPPLSESDNIVQVCYAGASVRDAKIATGTTVLTEQAFGMDFSGINKRGEKVMGVVSGGAIGSNVVVDPDLLWPVPEHWTLEDAATVPLAYTHAYYCLTIKSTLRKGLKVLINGGAGELGQAVISICLAMDCDVYVTGCDAEQKEFLLSIFPALQAENIGRAPLTVLQKIVDDVKKCGNYKTGLSARRCDIVINCLSGSMRKAAMKCVGFFGTLLDTCDYDMTKNEDFGMEYLFQATSYLGIRLKTIFSPEYANEKQLIQLRVAEGIAKGIVRPLSRVVYTPDNVTRAFRLLSAYKNRGKVLIRMKDLESMNQTLNVSARMSYCPKGSYIVVSDDTAFSIELVDRLVNGGARNLVIHMKPNRISGYCYTKFLSWHKLDVSLKMSSENLQTEKGCVNLLKEGSKLGPIRGIFIVHNFNTDESSGLEVVGTKFNNMAGVVANLDVMSRNVCNELDNFVVLNCSSRGVSDEYVSSVTDKICQSRNEIGLPALVFRAGPVKELDDSEAFHSTLQPQPLSAIFSALETSLKQKQTNVITYNLKKNAASEFIQRISRIIGAKNINDLDENLNLKDLLLNEVNIEEVNTAILNAYQISYPIQKLTRMTIANLKNLGRDFSQAISNNDSGLGAFFTYIDRDECSAAEPIVTMATSYNSVMEEEDLDPKATNLMLVPGFEGHHQIFTTVSERLKVQALTFQLTPDMSNDSIPQIAANIAKFARKRLELKSKFYLLGYSFGVNVALELARIFEKDGHVGVIYCLDSSPDALRDQLDAYIGNLTDSQLQNTIVEHMYELMSGRHATELKQELETKDKWNDKVELCVNKLRGLVNYSHQYKRCLLNSAYRRIILAREYEPDFKLESELVLLKGVPHPNMAKLADDYNLSKYTKNPVKMFDIESDHASAHQDCRVSNIVNRLLEPKLLEEFKNKNLCWTYLADPAKTL